MEKFPPIVYKGTALKLSKAAANEVVDPVYILSQESGQQLSQGTDNGVVLKGMVPKSAYPSSGDLCDLTVGTATKTALSLTRTYSDQVSGTFASALALPAATKTAAGLMTGEDKEALEDLRADVDAIQGGGSRLDERYFTFQVFDSDPSIRATQEAEITAYAVAEWGAADISGLPDNLSVHNANGGHLFRFNKTTGKWVDDGLDTVSIATDSAPGIVKAGDGTPGTVTVGQDGGMSVAGWSGVEFTVNKASSFGATPNNTRYPTEKLLADSLAAKESLTNKTAGLSASSTNDQYPTAKAVYDALAQKAGVGDKTTTLSPGSTDDQYPSAKAVYDALTGKEDVANKTTTLSGASTATQYPAASTVYAALSGKEDTANRVLSSTGLSSTSTDGQYPSAKTVWNALEAVRGELSDVAGELLGEFAGSVSFLRSDDVIYAILPASPTRMYVTTSYTDVTASIGLQIKLAGSASAAVTVSTSSAAPTDITALAGQAVQMTVTGMSSTAAVAIFVVRLYG